LRSRLARPGVITPGRDGHRRKMGAVHAPRPRTNICTGWSAASGAALTREFTGSSYDCAIRASQRRPRPLPCANPLFSVAGTVARSSCAQRDKSEPLPGTARASRGAQAMGIPSLWPTRLFTRGRREPKARSRDTPGFTFFPSECNKRQRRGHHDYDRARTCPRASTIPPGGAPRPRRRGADRRSSQKRRKRGRCALHVAQCKFGISCSIKSTPPATDSFARTRGPAAARGSGSSVTAVVGSS
jgi:hypothetical protein